jgi:hypothetical protein
MCIRNNARELDLGSLYADLRPPTLVNSPQQWLMVLNPLFI